MQPLERLTHGVAFRSGIIVLRAMTCWGTDYDWRKAEAKLNALPQFMTNID